MSMFEQTFEKHKKLVMESLRVINEVELYHATSRENLNSLAQGIDIKKAGKLHGGAGEKQGLGFYLFKKKSDALHHAKTMDNDAIVIIDQEINPDKFDVDYEAEYNYLKKFVLDNWDFFFGHWKELHVYTHAKRVAPPIMKGVFRISFDDEWTPTINANQSSSDITTDPESAKLWWKMVQEWKKLNPTLFRKFESDVLNAVRVLKYNGEEKIYPVRIEDLDGNVLWKK